MIPNVGGSEEVDGVDVYLKTLGRGDTRQLNNDLLRELVVFCKAYRYLRMNYEDRC